MEWRTGDLMDLGSVEYVKAYFHLEFCENCDLPSSALLQLRRECLRAFELLGQRQLVDDLTGFKQLFDPSLPFDPVVLKRVQKPAPAFVMSPDVRIEGPYKKGERIVLPLLLLGPAIFRLNAFWRLFDCLGELGLYKGLGRFFVEAVEGENSQGQKAMLWMQREERVELTPPICDFGWWLQRQPRDFQAVTIRILSPLRLMKQGKPAFKASFSDLFSFMLRRVSSMLALYGHAELTSDEFASLLDAAKQVQVTEKQTCWRDWRCLNGDAGPQNVGGLTGSLTVRGPALMQIAWILQLGSILNVGKSSAYGAGQYRLEILKNDDFMTENR